MTEVIGTIILPPMTTEMLDSLVKLAPRLAKCEITIGNIGKPEKDGEYHNLVEYLFSEAGHD